MRAKHVTMIGCLSLILVSCGLLESKSNGRRERDFSQDAVTGNGDVIADEGEPAAKPPVTEASSDPTMALTGKDLYAKLCASCHGKLEESNLGKTQLNKITTAIANAPEMTDLKDTKDADLEAIAAALSELPAGKGKGKPAE